LYGSGQRQKKAPPSTLPSALPKNPALSIPNPVGLTLLNPSGQTSVPLFHQSSQAEKIPEVAQTAKSKVLKAKSPKADETSTPTPTISVSLPSSQAIPVYFDSHSHSQSCRSSTLHLASTSTTLSTSPQNEYGHFKILSFLIGIRYQFFLRYVETKLF
jgi:hypothetical protein